MDLVFIICVLVLKVLKRVLNILQIRHLLVNLLSVFRNTVFLKVLQGFLAE